jgi:hypothetical protein
MILFENGSDSFAKFNRKYPVAFTLIVENKDGCGLVKEVLH